MKKITAAEFSNISSKKLESLKNIIVSILSLFCENDKNLPYILMRKLMHFAQDSLNKLSLSVSTKQPGFDERFGESKSGDDV